jgi:hypothetical protein
MNRTGIVLLVAFVVVVLAVIIGSRPFMASTGSQPGTPSPHAIDQ